MKTYTLDEIKKWQDKMVKEGKIEDWEVDHERGIEATQNRIRRLILEFLRSGQTLDQIKEHFNLSMKMAKYHMDFLEMALFVEEKQAGDKTLYVLTPRGYGFCSCLKSIYGR